MNINAGIAPTGRNYWYDSAIAKTNPDREDTRWHCSVRGPNGDVIAWAEGVDSHQTRSRAHAICEALNRDTVVPDLLAALRNAVSALEAVDGPGAVSRANRIHDAKAAIARATGTT